MVDVPDNSSTTEVVTVGSTTNGTLEVVGDHDWFKITLTAGQSITVTINGVTLEDPYLYIRDASGNLLFENDDISSGIIRDSELAFTANYTGTYYIDVGAWDEGYTGDYQIVVQPYTPPPLATTDQISDQLVSGYWGGQSHHFNVTQGGTITVNLTALTPAGQNLAREALALWSDIIGVAFNEVTSGGQIVFDDDEEGAFSDSIWSGGFITSSNVNVSTQWLAQYGTSLNSYSFQSYIHEIGHALGLGHAGNYNETARYPYDAEFQNDSWVTSVMSYFSQTENTYFAGRGFTQNFVVTPMMADILAMSTLYGLSTTTRTGNTTYGFNSNAGRAVFDASLNPGVSYTIFDSGGVDTLDYSGFSVSQRIDLNPESFSNVGGETGNVAIARGVVIENAVGGSASDTLIGNSAANSLNGNAGNDSLNGGAGDDTLAGGAGADVLDGGIDNDTLFSGGLSSDDFGLEQDQLIGGSGSDVLFIGYGDNADGGADFDKIYISYLGAAGGVTVDTAAISQGQPLAGGGVVSNVESLVYFRLTDFADTVIIGTQAELTTVFAADGNDYVVGQGSAISADGGGGNDTLGGSIVDDTLAGGIGADYLNGGAGNDVLYSFEVGRDDFGLEHDRLDGGAGNDIFLIGYGDNADGGAGFDKIYISYLAATGGVTVDTAAISQGQPLSGGGVVTNVESLVYFRLTDFADTVIIGTQAELTTVFAADGNDYVVGQGSAISVTGGAGNDALGGSIVDDTLAGDAGDDYINGGAGNDLLTGGTGADRFEISSLGGVDTITDFAVGEDRIDLSTLDAIAGTAANDAFTFIGDAAFSSTAGELRTYTENGVNYLAGDLDGDGAADFLINLASADVDASDLML